MSDPTYAEVEFRLTQAAQTGTTWAKRARRFILNQAETVKSMETVLAQREAQLSLVVALSAAFEEAGDDISRYVASVIRTVVEET